MTPVTGSQDKHDAPRLSRKALIGIILGVLAVALLVVVFFVVKSHKASDEAQQLESESSWTKLLTEDRETSGNGSGTGEQTQQAKEAPQEVSLPSGQTAVANSALVTIEDSLTQEELFARLNQRGIQVDTVEVIAQYPEDGSVLLLITYVGEEDPSAVCKKLGRVPGVIDAEPDYIVELDEGTDEGAEGQDDLDLAFSANDPKADLQWGLDAIGASDAWDYSKVEGDVIVAVIDSGVDTDHPDLADNLILDCAVNTYDDITGGQAVDDTGGHGTHVAGIISAVTNNGIGVAGVSFNAKILPMKAAYENSSGVMKLRLSDILEAIDIVISYKTGTSNVAYLPDICVLNMSIGLQTFNNPDNSLLFAKAMQRVFNAGILPVAAGGNGSGYSSAYYPASYEGVIGVSGVKNTEDGPVFDGLRFLHGPYIDLAAPGTNIYSTTMGGGYGYKTGTSMATPFVSGAAALLFAQDMTLTPGEVTKLLEARSQDKGSAGYDEYYGYGILRIDWAAAELSTWARFVRLAGIDRYATAQAISLQAFPEGCSTAIICTGKDFPDALAASSLAGVLDCPVLITDPKYLSASTRKAILDLGATDFIIVGGTGVVSQEVENELRSFGGTLDRLAGINRYATAEAVCSWEGVAARGGWSDTCIIATGENYPDALSISGFAFADKAPILLSSSKGLTPECREIIQAEGFDRALIVGGTGVVPETVEADLEDLGVSGGVIRLSGVNRYETSLAIAEYLLGEGYSADCSAIATGENYPDALTGSALVGRLESTMLLASPSNSTVFSLLGRETDNISRLYLLGGTGVVTTKMTEAARATLEPGILAG